MATGSGARQTAPAFQDSFSFRGAPVGGGASEEVLQIGKSMAGVAARNGKACAPNMPIGAANTAAAPARNNIRRLSNALSCISLDIFVSCFRRHGAAIGATR